MREMVVIMHIGAHFVLQRTNILLQMEMFPTFGELFVRQRNGIVVESAHYLPQSSILSDFRSSWGRMLLEMTNHEEPWTFTGLTEAPMGFTMVSPGKKSAPVEAARELPARPLASIDKLAKILAEPARWRLLRVMAQGETMPVKELARRIERTPGMTTKHLLILRDAGLVMKKYNRIYQLVPAIMPAPGATHLDLGWCLLKLGPWVALGEGG